MDFRAKIEGQPMTFVQLSTILICFLMNMLDGVDVLVISYTAPSIAKAWSLPPTALGVVFSAGLFGMTLGAFGLAPKADTIGRKPMILIAASLMGTSIVLTAFSQNISQLIFLRFSSGLGIGAMLASTATLISEYSPLRSRNFWVSFGLSGYPMGAFLSGLSAAHVIPLYGWNSMYLIAGIGTIATIPLISLFLAPSIDFLLKKRPKGALDKINKVLVKMKIAALPQLPEEKVELIKPSVKTLFNEPYRSNTVKLWVSFFLAFATLYFLVSWIPKLAQGAGLSLELAIYAGAVFNLGAFAGIVIQGFLSIRYSLRMTIAFFLFSSGALMAIFGFFSDSFMVLVIFGLIGFSIQGGFVGLYAVSTKLYPTEIRTTGVGWSIGAGRGGAIVGPLLGGLLIGAGFSITMNFIVFAIPIVIAGIAVMTIRFPRQ